MCDPLRTVVSGPILCEPLACITCSWYGGLRHTRRERSIVQKLDELPQAKLQERESERRCSTECQGSPGRRRGNSAFAVVLFIAFLAAMLLAWICWAA